ncbi:hypothetical protein EDB87DRAFT_401241, partial [Lactarius vividus]
EDLRVSLSELTTYRIPPAHLHILVYSGLVFKSILRPDNFCSAGVALESDELGQFATRPRDPGEVSFSCREHQGAVLYLPTQAERKNTLVSQDFGRWMIEHIDVWFAWSHRQGLEIAQMEDIVLVTGADRTQSWANIAFLGGQADVRASFGVEVDHSRINWQFSPERKMGAMWNWGPSGENLPEEQCIFFRGFRVRKRAILGPKLKAAAGPNPDPKDDDCERDAELISIPAVPKERPDCDVVIVHDDDLAMLDILGDGTLLETLQPDVLLSYLRSSKPMIHEAVLGPGLSSSTSTNSEIARIASLSATFERQSLRISDLESGRTTTTGLRLFMPIPRPLTSSKS